MKNILKLLIITLTITACSGEKGSAELDIANTKDVKALKKYRDELQTKEHEISAKIKAIDLKVDALTPQKKLPLITTFKTKVENFQHYLELQGNVATKQNLVLTPEMSGILTQVLVKEGQRVSKGQVLARIDDGGLSQQLAQLEIQANLAKTTYERQQRLWNQKIGSEIQYLQAKSAYESQQKMIEQTKSTLAKTAIRAPFSGVIDDVITERGSVVAPGSTQLMRIVNLSNMYISTDIPETYISQITKNKKVEVFFPVLNETINTSIRQVSNFINPSNRTFNVEIAVPNKQGKIKPNLTAKLKINDYTNDKAILIPQSIISENAKGEQYIYIIKDIENSIGTAEQIIIETGKSQGDSIEVLKGLKDNSEIIEEGARSVESGQKVQIINEKKAE